MYHRLPSAQYKRLTKTTYSDSSLLKIHSVADSNTVASDDSHHSLLQLIQQHQHQQGWILLIAPTYIPDKEWAEHYQLSLHNVLVVHQKQISDLGATIKQALNSASCKVVINFASQLDALQLDACRKLAVGNNTWFYQCEQIQQPQVAH
ncbi:SulA-like leucine-rich domain-containing protein [Rheinheimera maricola]|uniref:Cell division protein n=1 Tax=Rheinheimera maricola TaxID=2793282 RepID=A0ABS7XDB0_9GAMM|nr:SulA-like leucine-rich domain-containing protein [Rheinheimera maricola]MBZ9613553.1 hypothetical protein [Rheinheimera maricola]